MKTTNSVKTFVESELWKEKLSASPKAVDDSFGLDSDPARVISGDEIPRKRNKVVQILLQCMALWEATR